MQYSGHNNHPTYVCTRMMSDYGGEVCQRIAGPALNRFVTARVLKALAPASLDLSLEAAKNLQQERDALRALWNQRLERSRYEAERAARQYRLVEPENRLVARQVEREWEEKLAQQKKLEEEFHRIEHSQPRVLSEAERESIRRLSADIPALWSAPTTTDADRKEILRQVVDRIVVEAQGESERVKLAIHWAGGMKTEGEMIRPVRKLEQLTYYPQLCARIRALAAEGKNAREIAEGLNAEGYRPPKRCEFFGKQGVSELMRSLGLTQHRSRSKHREGLGEHEWWVGQLARMIPMPETTLFNWIRRGWVKARQQGERWVILADEAEIVQLRERHRRPMGYCTRRRWVDEAQGATREGADVTNGKE